jgi:hypothetical protein
MDLIVRTIKAPQTSNDGKLAKIVIETHDGEIYGFVFPSSHLEFAAETFVELCTSLKISGALADRNASNELTKLPELHRVSEIVGVVMPENESSIIDLELKTQQGLTLQLCFEPGQLQGLARMVLKIDEPAEVPGEH